MDERILEQIAFENLPSNICAITQMPINNPAIMHRDLSDHWPSALFDMRDDRLVNLLIVERESRDKYYAKLKQMGIVLAFSGGLDSTTVLHWCLNLFGSVHCLMFDYGQKHKIELEVATQYLDKISASSNLSWQCVKADIISELARSALTRGDIDVPRNTPMDDMGKTIPSTFVPGRNVYFITALTQIAFQFGYRHIALGVNVLDYSGYPDCRPEFLESIRKTLSIGVFNGKDFGLHAPLMSLDKKQIIRLGASLGVDYGITHSCYNGVLGGCGECDSCQLRRKAFWDLGMVDPAIAQQVKNP